MGGRSIRGERAAVARAGRRGEAALALHQWDTARDLLHRAVNPAVALVTAGRSDKDRAMLGSIYYQYAEASLMCDDVSMAWLMALQACRMYDVLDPTAGDPTRVAPCLAAAGWPHRRRAAEERIGLTADARSRYVMLTAALVSIRGDRVIAGEGAGRALLGITDASVVVQRIGDPAIRTYQELVRHGSRFSEHDIARTHERVTKAREILAS